MDLQLQLLEKAASEKRLVHLLIFHGGSEQYQKEVALRLAKILNCNNPGPLGPCQKCSACSKILTGNHPDVLWLKPLKTTIGIEQVLSWQEKVNLKHYEGNYKVSIIERADTMTLPAANALLKVIEEPPERTIIILSAENAERIIPTIRSRSQVVYFPFLSEENWLRSLGEVDWNEGTRAFHMSGENQSLATTILEYGVQALQKWVEQFCNAIAENDFLKLFPLFPIDKNQAMLYLQVIAVQTNEGIQKGTINPFALLAIGKAMDYIRQQANPRLVVEVLALELFQQGGTLSD